VLDEFHRLILAHTSQLYIIGANRDVAGSLRLLHDITYVPSVAGTRNRTIFYKLNAVALIVQSYDVKIRPLALEAIVVDGHVGCHGATRFL